VSEAARWDTFTDLNGMFTVLNRTVIALNRSGGDEAVRAFEES
jgi:hypothetical protein